MKITKKTAIIFTAALLVLAPTAAIVYAHSSGMGIGKGRWSGGTHNMMGTGTHNFNGTFRMNIVPILMGHGFALNPSDKSEYHVLDVMAMKVTNASQSQTRAYLRFAGQPYGLTITGYTNQSLTGTIVTVPPRGTSQTGFTPAPAGTISLSLSNYEGQMLATGTITINGANYNVLLSSPVVHSGGELRNFSGMHNFNGTFKLHNWTMKQ
ncbi:MAG: hypothetical protein ABOK23_00580 [Candidatus Methanoperedens sp.]|nr:hypothetical protein [Candidatus Methanoperedens sp.]MCZ7395850.1 hypothetical protein [Candidatus Methanoperedens sp.]